MDCERAQIQLLERSGGCLAEHEHRDLEAHLLSCASCRQSAQEEQLLSELLAQNLPKHVAPEGLKSQLRARFLPAETSEPVQRRRAPTPRRGMLLGLASGMLLMSGILGAGLLIGYLRFGFWAPHAELNRVLEEAVGDHLRVLYSESPVEIASGDTHQVKPWFSGRLDFAPLVNFAGDAEYPLVGGAVGYFVDRKAAVYLYRHRLHQISLFVMQEQGLPWPSGRHAAIGNLQASVASERGFNVITWRSLGLGYALVSDLSEPQLLQLAEKICAP